MGAFPFISVPSLAKTWSELLGRGFFAMLPLFARVGPGLSPVFWFKACQTWFFHEHDLTDNVSMCKYIVYTLHGRTIYN